jgi:hypothetical protein
MKYRHKIGFFFLVSDYFVIEDLPLELAYVLSENFTIMDETMYATTDRTANNEQHGTIDHNGTSFQPEETHQFNYTQTNGKASNASHADSIDLPELDGDSTEPIAICGFSIKFPDDATDPESLWNMILERRCAVAKFPPSRFNSEGFFHKRNMLNTVPNCLFTRMAPRIKHLITDQAILRFLSKGATSLRRTCLSSMQSSSLSPLRKHLQWTLCNDGFLKQLIELLKMVRCL